MTREERERQTATDIRNYHGTTKEQLEGIIKQLTLDKAHIHELNQLFTRTTMSKRLHRASKELDVLSRRVTHIV